MKTSRIPLALALSSALALAVGCTADRDDRALDGRADTPAAVDRADPQAAPPVGPVAADADASDAAAGRMDDGTRSDQPVDDTWITTKVKSALLADTDVSGLAIDVETVNGVVTLAGRVDSQAQVDHASRIARDIEGVVNVDTTGLRIEAR